MKIKTVAVCQCGVGPYDARGICCRCHVTVHGSERKRRYSVELLGPRYGDRIGNRRESKEGGTK